MLTVGLSTASGVNQLLVTDTPLRLSELYHHIPGSRKNFYIIHNGKLVDENVICYNGYISILPRLFGGKGGFGSMLRAIGAQIEKTTNREACRDLSGRRLRDINEEKRLKAWIEKQGKREEEAAERKKKKLERLCTEPRHEFKDNKYERERSALTERVGDAVEEGFKASQLELPATSGVKRKHDDDLKPVKKKMLLDLDIDSDELDTSDDSDEDENNLKKITTSTESVSNDSGHSSDGSGTSAQTSSKPTTGCIDTESDNDINYKIANNVENKKHSSLGNEAEQI